MRFACSICGGARIPVDDALVVRSNAELNSLRQAGYARLASWVWLVSAGVIGAFGLLAVAILSLVVAVANLGTLETLAGVAVVSVPLVAAALAVRWGRARTREAVAAVDHAWQMVIAEVAKAHGGEIDAPTIAKAMRIAEPEADRVLSAMSARSLLAGSVSPEGALRYRLLSEPRNPPQLP